MTWVHDATPAVEQTSHFPAIISVSVVFCSIMLIVVITRGIVRRNVLAWDDSIIFVSAVSAS